MQKKQSHAHEYRQLAVNVFDKLIEEDGVPEYQREDLVTSLVRQWISYGGVAALYLGDRLAYFVLEKTPLGRTLAARYSGNSEWLPTAVREWKIDPADLPDVIDQLNRGQSAEVTNEDGLPLRLWINPRERKQGVEQFGEQPRPLEGRTNYRKAAAAALKQQFGDKLAADEMEALTCSLVGQWQKYEGRACLFVGAERFLFHVTNHPEGGCEVASGHEPTYIDGLLRSLGFPENSLGEILAQINLDREIEFQDQRGARSVLRHNPKELRIIVETPGMKPAPASGNVPLFCPRCDAVLLPWFNGQPPQACRHCGHDLRSI